MLWAIASAPTLDECSALATEQLYDILIAAGMQPEDAACLMSLKCDLAVCQIVDPNMTLRAGLPVSLIEPKKEEKDR